MTQMRAMTQPFIQPAQALTTYDWAVGVRLHYFPMTSVDTAREEFGATLEDAKAFVAGVTCQECGAEGGAGNECADCGVPVCACFRDPHDDDVMFCADCNRTARCGCRSCWDD